MLIYHFKDRVNIADKSLVIIRQQSDSDFVATPGSIRDICELPAPYHFVFAEVSADRICDGRYEHLLNGHTHVPAIKNMDAYTYMNPGSVAIPKDGSAHGYMLYDGDFLWKDLDGNVWHKH